jgi:hypothetical protein
MPMKSLTFAAASVALLACPALAQDNPPATDTAPIVNTDDAPAPSPEVELTTPDTTAQTPEQGGIATRSFEDLKSGIDKGDDLPGCRRKNDHIA